MVKRVTENAPLKYNFVFCLIIIHIAIKSLAITIFLTSMMPIIVL
jgi:hypothetical protein